jgi:hypothetical protein
MAELEGGGGSEGRSDLGVTLEDAARFTSPPSPTGSHRIRMREWGLLAGPYLQACCLY